MPFTLGQQEAFRFTEPEDRGGITSAAPATSEQIKQEILVRQARFSTILLDFVIYTIHGHAALFWFVVVDFLFRL